MFWDFGVELGLHETSKYKEQPCHVNCDCGRFMEIGNNVFMEYIRAENGFEKLKQQKDIKKVGGASYLTDIANKVPTAAHVEHYGKIVKDLSIKRNLMQAASKIVEMSLNESLTSSDLMDRAESEVFSLSQKNVKKANGNVFSHCCGYYCCGLLFFAA
jgi:hypothetical protein